MQRLHFQLWRCQSRLSTALQTQLQPAGPCHSWALLSSEQQLSRALCTAPTHAAAVSQAPARQHAGLVARAVPPTSSQRLTDLHPTHSQLLHRLHYSCLQRSFHSSPLSQQAETSDSEDSSTEDDSAPQTAATAPAQSGEAVAEHKARPSGANPASRASGAAALRSREAAREQEAKQRRSHRKLLANRNIPEQAQAYFRAYYPIRIVNTGRRVLRSDVRAFLQHLDVTEDDIRVEYDQNLLPVAWWADLKTEEEQEIALTYHRAFLGARRAFITAETPRAMRIAILSPLAMGSRGRYCMMNGIQNSATLEDIVRFFRGFDIMGNAVTIVKENVLDSRHPEQMRKRAQSEKVAGALGVPDEPDHRAVVRFMTAEEAHRAVRSKNGTHLLNQAIRLRVLP